MNYRDNILVVAQGAGFQACEFDCAGFEAFCERDIVPGYAMASSGSALFTSLFYSRGMEWVKNMILSSKPSDFIDICYYQSLKTAFGKSNHLIDNSKIRTLLEENMTGEASKRVKVSVTKLDDWTTHMKNATPAFTLAATSIPFVFKPVKIGGCIWGDGGVFNNIPCPTLEEAKKWKHIFVFVSPKYEPSGSETGISGLLDLLNAVFDREFKQLEESGFFELPNVSLIQPDSASGGGLFSWSEDFKMMKNCYEKISKILDELDL